MESGSPVGDFIEYLVFDGEDSKEETGSFVSLADAVYFAAERGDFTVHTLAEFYKKQGVV
jgi:hypothetical protein